ncbi:hypothetical protein BD770DRAFT_445148 [Pilaira anomala]|nr:hypothetical protein BD770DRAFT_445148 [Pilaira anomala]
MESHLPNASALTASLDQLRYSTEKLLMWTPQMHEHYDSIIKTSQKKILFLAILSDLYQLLTPTQRNNVLFGLERDEEWPVLVICPNILRETWKYEIKNWLGLDDDEIYILNSKAATKDTFKQTGV